MMKKQRKPSYEEIERRLEAAESALRAIREGQADTIMDEQGRGLVVRLADAEVALRQSHAMLTRTEAIAQMGSWEWEIESDRVSWSDELFRIFGRDPAAGAPSFVEHPQLYVSEDMKRLKEAVEACVSRGKPYEIELQAIRADGQSRHCIARGIPQKDENGRIVRLTGSIQDVTEQRRQEERIALLGRMSDEAPASLTLHDTEGCFLFANRRTFAMHGYSEEEFMAVNLHDLDVPESEALLAERFRLIAEKGEATFEVEHYRKDGTVFPLQVLAKAFEWEGRPAVFSIAADITDRKRADEVLKTSERFLRSTVDGLSAHIAVLDDRGEIILTNKSYRDFGERNGVELRAVSEGTNYLAVCDTVSGEHSEEAKPFAKGIREVLSGKRPSFKLEYPCHSPDEKRWFIGRVTPFTGEGPRRVVVAHENITDRKRAEEALREERERLENVLIATRTGIDVIDGNFNLHFVDRGWQKVYGDPTGRKCYEYFNGLSEPCPGCCIPKALATKQVVITEEVLPRENNRPIEVRIFPFQNAEGQWLVAAVNIDITDRKRAETERGKLQTQLLQSQKMESVGRLAGGVAHDFNNMLNVIIGFTELSLEKITPGDLLHENLNEILDAARRSAEITRQLLAFARRQIISPRPLDLNETVEGMLRMLRRLIGEDIDLVWEPGSGLWTVMMDPSQLDQVLANLLVNARDAIKGVGKITIETAKVNLDINCCADRADFVPGDYVLLAVSDNGCGMDKETLDNLFEPFFTTKGLGEGTGLGLATVYGIIKQNNGFINVYSEPGQGATFKIYLPRYTGEAEAIEEEGSAAIPPGKGETILVVEDETAVLKLAGKVLTGLGYTVLTAATPAEALKLAEERRGAIDLLMTDVIMPEMNGRDLAERLRAHYPGLKIMFMSGYTADVIAHHGILDKGVLFIQKPFNRMDLARKVREALAM